MRTTHRNVPHPVRPLEVTLTATALQLAACATTTTLTRTPITGFGSIIVNGVRFDDSAALVRDDDGAASGRDRLSLGMQVEVESEAVSDDGQGFVLRGLTVQLTASTEFRGLSRADLARSDLRIELKGGLAADGVTVPASRISRKD
jgi:hypothetical protein